MKQWQVTHLKCNERNIYKYFYTMNVLAVLYSGVGELGFPGKSAKPQRDPSHASSQKYLTNP